MSQTIPPHPQPPKDLNERELPLLQESGPWFRIHQSKYAALHFAKEAQNRFDAPNQEYGVLYCAQDPYGAFIETLGWSTGQREISLRKIIARNLSNITSKRLLRLVDLTGAGLAQLGADAELCTGRDRTISQIWSHALWSHPERPDGICYFSRHDPQKICYAFFDHSSSALNVKDLCNLYGEEFRKQLGEILDHYQFALID